MLLEIPAPNALLKQEGLQLTEASFRDNEIFLDNIQQSDRDTEYTKAHASAKDSKDVALLRSR